VLEGLEPLGDRRVLVLAADGAAEVGHGEPGVGQIAVRGDDPQVLLVGASAAGAEVLQRRAAELRGVGELLEAADVRQRHRGADAPPDLLLLEHEPWTVRGQNRTGLDSKCRSG
jgi:hypothetical protein